MSTAHDTAVAFRPASSPESPGANWRGFAPGSSVLPSGTTYSPNGRKLACDIGFDRDVPIELPDGTKIFADVYRPIGESPVPAILVWSPYGKQGGFWTYELFPQRAGVPEHATSGLEKFEGPDPAFWCANGYAVVNVDPRGVFESEGDGQFFSDQEARDGYDTVEWIADQRWCNGAVVMAGNSWLAAMQWRIAALHPPHLTAIAPWEGFTDVYRDAVCRGGIPEQLFVETLVSNYFGRHRVEDPIAMLDEHPHLDDYWKSKIARIEDIDVPAYVVASWTNPLHVRGTLDAFSRLNSERSWLRVHNTFEWPDQYSNEGDLLSFFDHMVGRRDSSWPQTPRVRLSILNPGGIDIVARPESEWPLARARARRLYLDAANQALTATTQKTSSTVIKAGREMATFRVRFDADIELTGPLAVQLFLEADQMGDTDLYVFVRKLSSSGEPLLHWLPVGAPIPGAKGQLRLSHRALDEDVSTALVPVHRHDGAEPLAPGEIVAVDIPIWPLGMFWSAGEQLELLVSGRDLFPTAAMVTGPPNEDIDSSDTGSIILYTGESHPSCLTVSEV